MTRRSLFQTILGGIAAIFMPKSGKKPEKTNVLQKFQKSGKWIGIQLKVNQIDTNCSATCSFPPMTIVGLPDDNKSLIYSIWQEGKQIYPLKF